MYDPIKVWLATAPDGERWLTDQFVMLRVSGSLALQPLEFTEFFGELKDGCYKLTTANGLVPRDDPWRCDLEAYFASLAGKWWYGVSPSEWSVAEHPGKAMLWTYTGAPLTRLPCLIGEPTWTQIKRHHPEVEVSYAPEVNIFRFFENGVALCFAAGIQIPDGQEAMALALAQAA